MAVADATDVYRRLGTQVAKWAASSTPAPTAQRRSREVRPRSSSSREASATGAIAATARALRHIAMASAGAAAAAINGPDVDTATSPTAISARSARGGLATTPGVGAGCRVTGTSSGTASRCDRSTCGRLATVADPLARSLVEEACAKSALVWLREPGERRAHAAWHVWTDGAVHIVTGGAEQPLAGLTLPEGAEVEVVVRSKDTGGRLVTFRAAVSDVRPGSPSWDPVVRELHAKRLNPPDGEAQPARWARESRVLRLEPTGDLTERPGHMPSRSHAAEPPASEATTRGPLPFVLGRRARRRPLTR